MDKTTQTQLNNLWIDDRDLQNKAFSYILEATDKPVAKVKESSFATEFFEKDSFFSMISVAKQLTGDPT